MTDHIETPEPVAEVVYCPTHGAFLGLRTCPQCDDLAAEGADMTDAEDDE